MTTEANAVTTYGYDKINRLTSAIIGSSTESWSYDANSNRTLATKTSAANIHSAFNAADQLCWTGPATGTCTTPPAGATDYNYDANGNTTAAGTTTSAWNVFDQLTSTTTAGTTTNYTYAGLRNDERTTAGATSFLNGTLGTTRQTTGGASTSFIRDPDGTLISMRNSAGASFYYTTDALGSVLTLTDSAQAKAATYTYDSWGTTTATGAQATTNPWQYAGGYKDTTTGLTKFGARYYTPGIGRFTQPDPSSQEDNRYRYAAANPINNTDQSGLFYVSFGGNLCFFACIGAAVTYDWETGLSVGLSGGLGPRFEAGATLIGGLGSGTGPSTSVECAGKFMGGFTAGLGLISPDLYGGSGIGYGGGCSLQQSYNVPIF
jgi:RHS repeat-associated protein